MNIAILAVLLALQSPATVGQEAAETPRQRYDALVKEYAAAVEVWSKNYDQASQKPDPIKRHLDWPAWSFTPRFFKLAEDHPGDPAAVDALFSGNWCGPCLAMYPDERDLVKRLKDQPFALVSVNTDGERSTLQKSIKDGQITWRCWWDGPNRPICQRWNVRSFPTVYVLDRAGVIRFTDRRGSSLDHAVMSLLEEAPGPKS
jgi:thiol-disulfide isomerase/thioredoxin